MTLLSIVTDTCGRLGLTQPSMVVGSTDLQVRQLLALANEEGASLAKRNDWQALTTEATFITTATEVQGNTPIPTDLDRFCPDTFFNRTQQRPLIGPVTPQEWQAIQAQPVLGFVYLTFRERQGEFIMTPVPTAGDTVAYEYVSKNWAKSSGNQPKASFTSDDDTTYLDEELIKLGLRWRFLKAKGLSYAQDFDTYERAVEAKSGTDGGTRALDMSGYDRWYFPGRPNLPQGSFGL